MTKRRNKKRTLMASIISLILCISMLLGTTMAWFTDTVTNSGNRITTGELGVKLRKYNGTTPYDDISNGTGDIFATEGEDGERLNGVLWEPGKTEVVLLQVENTGNLALNYNIILDVTNETDVALERALSYAILPDVDAAAYSAAGITGWKDILNQQGVETGAVAKGTTKAAPNGALLAGESDYFALAVHMDENAGNEYQNQSIVIDVKVEAKQMVYEYDSFGNEYDADADYSDLNFDIIIPDDDLDPATFDVYQKHQAYSRNATSGFAIVAEFDGAPGQIYVARTTVAPTDRYTYPYDAPYAPSAMARVEDPDGNLAAIYDFSDLTDGREAVIIDIPEGKAGIWTIRMMNGYNDDIFEIAVNDCEHWGVRGERMLGNGNLPQSTYIYIPKAIQSVGFLSDSTGFALYDLNGSLVSETVLNTDFKPSYIWDNFEQVKYKLKFTETIQTDTVYELRLDDGFEGSMVMDGIPSILCPTPEDAAALKGALVEYDEDEVYAGPLQARARAELARLASTKDLTVTVDKPDEIPWDQVKYPIAEAQLFGAYGVLSGLSGSINRQVLDPESPLCGRVYGYTTWDYVTSSPKNPNSDLGFLKGFYKGADGTLALEMAAAATLDLELNYFYENEALITRAAMNILSKIVTGVDEGGMLREGNIESGWYPMGGMSFQYLYITRAYSLIRPYLEDTTIEVLDECLGLLTDKIGDYRGMLLTNQAAFCMSGRLYMYIATGEERYLESFERQIVSIIDGEWYDCIAFCEPGFFVELGSMDAQYEAMNRNMYFSLYANYKNLENADPAVVEKMHWMVETALDFESHFTVPQPTGSSADCVGTNIFCARTTADNIIGGNAQPTYEIVYNEFPIAARRMQVIGKNWGLDNLLGRSASWPATINTEEWAKAHIEKFWNEYYEYYENRGQNRYGSPYALDVYASMTSDTYVEAGKLPCEQEEGYLKENNDGFVAFKHQGIYITSFYNVACDMYGDGSFAAAQFMGGGPINIWNEGTGTTVVSRKHLNNNPGNASQIIASSIYGTDEDGTFFYSGKERADLIWLEEGKSFVIAGKEAKTGKTVSWQYDLTDEGVDITAGLSSESGINGEYWMNLPIYAVEEGNNSTITFEENKLTFAFGDATMEYTWGSNVEAKMEKVSNYQCLRLKLSLDSASAKVSICVK